MLTDEQCNEFRRLPGSFNDMVRAIHRDGMLKAAKLAENKFPINSGYHPELKRAGFIIANAIRKEAGE